MITTKAITPHHEAQLSQAFSSWVTLSPNSWSQLIAIFQTRTAVAKEHIMHPGDNAHELMFVCDGLLRFYYLSPNGKETNKAFIAENEFAGPLASTMLNLPIYYGVQALENTTYLVAPLADFTALYTADPLFERIGRKLAELLLMRKEIRMRSMLEQTATERYIDFKEKNQSLVDRIPQYQLAAYLGISDVSLSRLKNKTE